MKTVFQAIYDSEINFRIECFWDGGFTIKLGDGINGFKPDEVADTWEEIPAVLTEMVLVHYPESEFAKSVAMASDSIVIVCQPAIADRVRALLDAHEADNV